MGRVAPVALEFKLAVGDVFINVELSSGVADGEEPNVVAISGVDDGAVESVTLDVLNGSSEETSWVLFAAVVLTLAIELPDVGASVKLAVDVALTADELSVSVVLPAEGVELVAVIEPTSPLDPAVGDVPVVNDKAVERLVALTDEPPIESKVDETGSVVRLAGPDPSGVMLPVDVLFATVVSKPDAEKDVGSELD